MADEKNGIDEVKYQALSGILNLALESNASLEYAFWSMLNLGQLNGALAPAGGTTGQVLAKASNTDYDLEWITGGGGGGTWGSITGTLSSQTDLQTALNAKEPTITTGTSAQYIRGDKALATLDKTAVGLANVDNTTDAGKPVSTATQTALNLKLNSSAISAYGLTLVDDADAATARGTLGLGTLATQSGTFSGTSSGTNTGDQTTIVGITGTKAQFDTAVTDGNIMYIGDAPTTHTHVQSDITGLVASLSAKQDTLVSATNIKTINGTTILGSGNLVVTGSGSSPIMAWAI